MNMQIIPHEGTREIKFGMTQKEIEEIINVKTCISIDVEETSVSGSIILSTFVFYNNFILVRYDNQCRCNQISLFSHQGDIFFNDCNLSSMSMMELKKFLLDYDPDIWIDFDTSNPVYESDAGEKFRALSFKHDLLFDFSLNPGILGVIDQESNNHTLEITIYREGLTKDENFQEYQSYLDEQKRITIEEKIKTGLTIFPNKGVDNLRFGMSPEEIEKTINMPPDLYKMVEDNFRVDYYYFGQVVYKNDNCILFGIDSDSCPVFLNNQNLAKMRTRQIKKLLLELDNDLTTQKKDGINFISPKLNLVVSVETDRKPYINVANEIYEVLEKII